MPRAARPGPSALAVLTVSRKHQDVDTSADAVVEELTSSQSWQLLRDAPVGRLAVVLGDGPEIFPVNHVVDHGSVVFRTGEGTKLRGAIGRAVAYEADGVDATGRAWSVVVKGHAHEVLQLHELIDALDLPLFPWQAGLKPRFVRIVAEQVTGRRFVPRRR